jgi:hypothetical protein
MLACPSARNRSSYRRRSKDDVIVFPDPDSQPTSGRQLLVRVAISPHVAGDLVRPVPRVLDVVNSPVLLAAVPEAPVDEHGDPRARK